jgi:nitrite reductase (NO-forming)
MNRSLLLASTLVASFLLTSGIALVPYFSGNNVAHAQETEEGQGQVKHVTLIASEKQVQVAPDNALHPGGIMYNAMVFNGTIPGPVISIDQGDTLNITLKNEGQTIHSMDFHAGFGPDKANSGSVKPGESKTWTLTGEFPGVFFYHCSGDSLNGIWEHIANGMYGGIVVHPSTEEEAKEFYLVYGEIYNNADKGIFNGTNGTAGSFDVGKLLSDKPDLVLTNGMAHKYVPAVGEVAKLELNKDAELFKVKPGELTRWYIVNAGPNDVVSFHFISGMINVRDGTNTANTALGTQDRNDETWLIGPGSASVIESTFPDPGIYVGVDHSMKDVVKGGALAVVAMENSTATDHPTGTCVAPKGSETVTCATPSPSAETESTESQDNATESASQDESDTNTGNGDNGGNGGNGDTEVTQNATMLNTSSSNMTTGNETMMGGNMTSNMSGMTGGNSTMGN